jgi:hypothetical protein
MPHAAPAPALPALGKRPVRGCKQGQRGDNSYDGYDMLLSQWLLLWAGFFLWKIHRRAKEPR